ncbi:cadherin-23-like [Gigantopelta aegis]|uniref:cadherin-23-like n=1 Tax=Gigantopelta aegis TaxID=1735272 RepID=UPI001B8873E1|nr:cadherin-23-like [Gigantopelta aegis]
MATHATFSLSADGWISLKSSLNFEAASVFTLSVVASDRGTTPQRSATATVSITVTDVNDNAPVCNPDVVSLTKREDATGSVVTLVCTDADSGANQALTYSILSVNGLAGAGPFAVSTAGVISIGTNLDYETAVTHAIVVSVVDGGTVKLSTSVIINIAVTDVNEFSPVLTAAPFVYSFPESDPVGTTLLTIAAMDGDASDTTLSFSLSDTSVFTIDSATGVITLKVQQDRETRSTYSLNVCAADSNTVDAVKTQCESLTITVTDVNDNTPVFSPAVYSKTVDENSAIGISLLKVTATDQDLGAQGTVSYSILSGNTGNVFRVDPVSGDLIINDNAALDYEVNPSFDLVIQATDGGGLVGSATVRITTGPINEATPQFSPSTSTQTLAENSALGSTVIDLGATDADTGADGVVTYSIVSGGNGKFAIDPTTGIVTVSGPLDRESDQSFTLTIIGVDGGTNPGAKTGVYTLIVDITDVNDITPSCTLTYYSSFISETAGPATIVGQVTCSDGDLDPANLNNALVFTEMGGDAGGLFDVNVNTGEITVSTGASFDRETTASYLLDISVSDKGTTPLSVSVQMFVGLNDVNDQTPVFGSNPYSPSVSEADAIGTTVVTIAATDTDIGVNAEVSYSVPSGNGLGHFQLDSATGVITVKAALDFESNPLYTLVVEATDKGSPALTGTSTVSITVTNTNDNTPVCPSAVYTATVAEDAATTTSLLTVACTDADGDTVQYTITSGLTSTEFAIGASTGEITVNGALDAETKATYSLTVQASDGVNSALVTMEISISDVNENDPVFTPAGPYTISVPENSAIGFTGFSTGKHSVRTRSLLTSPTEPGQGSRTAQTTLTVTVTDVNDNDPVCSPSNYYQTVAENAAVGTTVDTVLCTDVDSSTPVLAYSITGGNGDGRFGIDAASGVVTIVAVLDYETTTQYTLAVQASDQGTTPRTVTAMISVIVDPVNEATPVFTPATYTKTLLENAAVNDLVITVAATDPDKGNQHGTIRYTIVTGDGLAQFKIDASSGVISVAKPLDREAIGSYTLSVSGTDSVPGAAEAKSSFTTVTVTINDVNDNTPMLTPSSYASSVLESAVSGTTVLRVTSTDDDTGVNGSPLYSILSGNTNSEFEFVGNELLIAAGKSLDYESITSYYLTIEVKDQGTTALSSTGIININILSVNEFPPVLVDATKMISISEMTPAGANLYNASASDSDSGTDGTFTYSITNGNTGNLFYINSLSGEVYLFGILDYDTPPQSYSLTIQAQDSGGLSNTMVLTVQLLDENDHTPVFTANTYNAQLDENVAGGTSVTRVTANDNDSGVNGQVTYAIKSGDGLAMFDIDPTTGEIKTKAAASIDREVKDQYFLVVEAADGGTTSLSSSCLVKISINDLNDNKPIFTPENFTVSILETSIVGTSVTTVIAVDADSSANGNNIIVYTLTDTYFTVDSASGQVDTKAVVDRETIPSHYLTIQATDQGAGPLTGTSYIAVTILDVNDNDPVIQGTYTTTVSEDTSTGTIVFTITATDADDGVNSQLTFSITNGNTDSDFRIESQTGIIDIVNSLNRERTTSYNLQIMVTDNGTPSRSALITAVVTVDDVNDNNPVFGAATYSFNVAEDTAVTTSIGAVAATDIDAGVNAALAYEFVMFWVGDSTHFVIDGVNGDIKTASALDREVADTYIIWCRVQDGGSPFRTANVNLTITVTDINDNQPTFDQTSYSATVLENSAVGTSITTYTVTDQDTGVNGAVTLTIDTSTAAGTKANTFLAIDSATGILSVLTSIDRETDQLFEFTVVAVDGGTPARTGTATCTVTVLDENDNVPVHSQMFYNSEVAYTGSCSNVVTMLAATDADSGVNGQLSFFLVQSNFDYLFAVDGTTGIVTLQTTAIANFKYILEAGVRDNGNPVQTSANFATLRIDTFDPNTVVTQFRLQISEADFLLKKDEFLVNLNAIIQAVYPTATVKIWCVQEREGTATTPTGRRRLLASAPVNVLVYTVGDNTTDLQANSGQGKTFLTSGSVLALTTTDANGNPSSAITGTAFDYYGIETVTPYYQVTTPWHQTATGIAIITLSCILMAVLIGLIIYLIFRTCRKRGQRPITPVRPKDEHRNNLKPDTKKPQLITHKGYVPDLDQDPKKHPLPAVAALPMPAKPNTSTQFWGPPDKPESRMSLNNSRLSSRDSRLDNNPRTPRSVIIQPREFTGKAVDPVTNKVYEYNTRTNERKWVVSPVGKVLMGTDANV